MQKVKFIYNNSFENILNNVPKINLESCFSSEEEYKNRFFIM